MCKHSVPDIKNIVSRLQIPEDERYILVMGGLSNSETHHSLGTTIVINNSRANSERLIAASAAIGRALAIAEEQNIETVFILE